MTEARHKRLHIVQFQLYEVQKQVELIYDSRNSPLGRRNLMSRRGKRGLLAMDTVLVINLDDDFIDEFILQKFIELYTYDLYTSTKQFI